MKNFGPPRTLPFVVRNHPCTVLYFILTLLGISCIAPAVLFTVHDYPIALVAWIPVTIQFLVFGIALDLIFGTKFQISVSPPDEEMTLHITPPLHVRLFCCWRNTKSRNNVSIPFSKVAFIYTNVRRGGSEVVIHLTDSKIYKTKSAFSDEDAYHLAACVNTVVSTKYPRNQLVQIVGGPTTFQQMEGSSLLNSNKKMLSTPYYPLNGHHQPSPNMNSINQHQPQGMYGYQTENPHAYIVSPNPDVEDGPYNSMATAPEEDQADDAGAVPKTE
ncbi:hypothetical protein BLNAU_16281 [Blattamonas nauphoetae]|uniref:Uncharacterized protein n=1 Tax=Blattamonas nauphoetae TaxID=2049346 RepID=A0ABQ9XEM1_9EUKA|nr:hypothetical protein BLNAU_16281 [Blattamonas nauphoetae]